MLPRIGPLTYIVGPMRHAVFSHLTIAPVFEQRLAPGVTWGGWLGPLWLPIGIVAIMSLGMMAFGDAEFRKTE